MSILLLALVAALQTQSTPPVIQVVALTPARPASTAPAPTPPPVATTVETPAEAEVEAEEEPAVEQPRTREVCRYVERPGWRFAERRCRTVVIDDDR